MLRSFRDQEPKKRVLSPSIWSTSPLRSKTWGAFSFSKRNTIPAPREITIGIRRKSAREFRFGPGVAPTTPGAVPVLLVLEVVVEVTFDVDVVVVCRVVVD